MNAKRQEIKNKCITLIYAINFRIRFKRLFFTTIGIKMTVNY